MIAGCGPGAASNTEWSAPLVVDLRSVSCAKADPAARRESRRTTKAPEPDVSDATGKRAVSEDRFKSKVDELRLSEARKNAAMRRALDEQDRCAGGAAPAAIAAR